MNPNAPNRPPPQTAVSGVTQQMNQMNIRPRPPNPAPARPGFRPQGARPVARPQQRPTRPSLASQGSAPNQLGNAQSASQSPQMHSSANSPSGMANGSVPSQPTRMPPNQSFPSPPNQSGMTNGVAPNQAPKMPGNQSFPSSPNQSGLQAGQSGTSTGKPLMQPHSQQSQTFAPPAQNPSFRPPVQAADHSFMPNGMPNQPGVINQSFGQTGAPNQSFGQPGMINQQPGVNQPFGQHGMPARPGIFGQPVTPNQSFGQPGMPSQSFGQPGMPSQSIGQPGMPSQSFGQPGMPNQSFGQPGMPGQTFGQPGIPHQSFGQPGIPNQSFGQPGMPAQNPSFRPPGQTTNQSIIPNGMPNQAGMQPSNPYGQSGSNFTAPGFQQQRPGFQAGPVKPKIDPDQIPNPAAVHALDEETHRKNIFSTTSRMQPPLAITRFRAQDHGSCNPRFLRSTLYNIPATNELLAQSGIPFGFICQPLADVDPLENPVPVADFTKMGPPRCLRCNAFINPYFQFVEGGRKFNCNICSAQSEVSPEYFANLDMNGRRVDINQRLELLYGSCDFAVANEYCARPPKPITYLFAIDVSWSAVQNGMVSVICRAIKDFLYSGKYTLPKGATVGFITFAREIHFYHLAAELEQFQMMVVSDVEDVFVPLNAGLAVDPVNCKKLVEMLLDSLPRLFSSGERVVEACGGSVAHVAYEALKKTGGKVFMFLTSLPTFGMGALKNRENVKLLGTDKEKTLFEPQDFFWTKLGQSCATSGVCVETFLFPSAYIDLATVGAVSSLSGGNQNLYMNFDARKHSEKLSQDFCRSISRSFGYDALLRARVSTGLQVSDYLGNFYMKNATDIDLGGVDSLKAVAIGVQYTAKLSDRTDAYCQVAMLYTTSEGQRRVRVHNLAVPVTSQLSDVFRHAELDATINMLSRAAVRKAFQSSLKSLRDDLGAVCVKILSSYRVNCASGSSPGQLILPEALKLLPLYILSLMKSRAFRNGKLVPSDQRVYTMRLVNSIGVLESCLYLYPKIYDVGSFHIGVGDINEFGLMQLPPIVRVSTDRLKPTSVYIAENGRHMFVWVGSQVDPSVLVDLFGVDNGSAINADTHALPPLESSHSRQVRVIIDYLRKLRPRFMQLSIVREGLDVQNAMRFSNLLIEDANLDNMSYVDFLCNVHRSIQGNISK